MNAEPDRGRRRFVGRAAMTIAAAQFGMFDRMHAAASGILAGTGTPQSSDRTPRQLAALDRATAWLDSPALPASSLVGQVVLVQFGTYTCINWLRTLPYVRAWHQKYRHGLTVVGVHTPEFAFEKDLENVRRAVPQLKLGYPNAVDNDYVIWRAFNNHYWPALYLLDSRGRIRYHHFGEGEYERSERAIQQVLADAGAKSGEPGLVTVKPAGVELPADWQQLKSPEMYLGYDRAEAFSSPGGAALARRRVYAAPPRLELNRWALAGEWTMGSQPASLGKAPGRIVCRFRARDVHLVMGPARRDSPVRFRVSLDGKPPGPAGGLDVDAGGGGTAVDQRLYQLIRQQGSIVERTVEIEFLDAGLEAFAFTFG